MRTEVLHGNEEKERCLAYDLPLNSPSNHVPCLYSSLGIHKMTYTKDQSN